MNWGGGLVCGGFGKGRGEEPAGAEGQNRTADTTIFSRVLYRLSYLGLPRQHTSAWAIRGAGVCQA